MADHQTDDRPIAFSYDEAYNSNEPSTGTRPKNIIVLSDSEASVKSPPKRKKNKNGKRKRKSITSKSRDLDTFVYA